MSEEHKQKVSDSRKGGTSWNKGLKQWGIVGEKSPNWKGDRAGYDAIHKWLTAHFGKANHCDLCGKVNDKPFQFQWSCRTGIYNRHHWNWWQLCIPCHKNYDLYFLLEGKHNTGKYKR